MPKALVLIADGTEEIEFVTAYDGIVPLSSIAPPGAMQVIVVVLVRAGFSVKSAGVGLQNEHADCSRHVRIIPDIHTLSTAHGTDLTSEYDVLVLPGGAPGAATFCSHKPILHLISDFRKVGKWIAAICAGTTALVASVENHPGDKGNVTSHPSVEADIKKQGWAYSQERCVVDQEKKLITSRGPGTALLFALTIVEQISGKEKRKELEGPIIMPASDSLADLASHVL